ncbi:MAG: NAAT family transporter [Sideroxydans sp.]|nr:NAAT family transporter [Sideroxydans sp.]
MSGLLSHTITVFLAFFAIMNPVANTPLFLSLTEGDEPAVKRQVAFQSVMIAFALVLLFCLFGRFIFEMFGITLPAFRIAGGAVVILIGFQMLHGTPSRVHHPSAEVAAETREVQLSMAVSPLAMPILAGPGTLATAINFSSTSSIADIVITLSDFAVLCLITYVFFLTGERLVTFIGKGGVNVVTRMMGLILAVIGTQMIIEGIHGAGF